jgi:uncharacterized protein YxeA
MNFSQGKTQVPRRDTCFEIFCNNNHLMFCLFLYMLATYQWKGFEESYNFVVWKHFNQNSYVKIMITQNFEHICSLGNMVVP